MPTAKNNNLSASLEDYLEAILNLAGQSNVVRSRDIAAALSVSKASVNAALANLSKGGLVIHERYSYVELTPEGRRLAQSVQNRHDTLFRFLTEILGIDPKIATEDACKIEHSISPQTLKKITKFIKFVETCPGQDKPDWLKSFDYYFKTGRRRTCKVRRQKLKA
jgi:DtxR family Mn-dependent transcriptional regulator